MADPEKPAALPVTQVALGYGGGHPVAPTQQGQQQSQQQLQQLQEANIGAILQAPAYARLGISKLKSRVGLKQSRREGQMNDVQALINGVSAILFCIISIVVAALLPLAVIVIGVVFNRCRAAPWLPNMLIAFGCFLLYDMIIWCLVVVVYIAATKYHIKVFHYICLGSAYFFCAFMLLFTLVVDLAVFTVWAMLVEGGRCPVTLLNYALAIAVLSFIALPFCCCCCCFVGILSFNDEDKKSDEQGGDTENQATPTVQAPGV